MQAVASAGRYVRTLGVVVLVGAVAAACDSGVETDALTGVEGTFAKKGPPGKVLVCHVGNELPEYDPACTEGCGDAGKIDLIEVANPAKHLGNPAHTYDGQSDYDPVEAGATGEGKEDSDGNGIDDGCEIPDDETIFAIAYTNVDGVPGFDGSNGDVLIAKVVDADGSGAISEDDEVITNQYPLDPVPTGFGSFGVNSHVVTRVSTVLSTPTIQLVTVETAGGRMTFLNFPGVSEVYQERDPGGTQTVQLGDGVDPNQNEMEVVENAGPSQPNTPVSQILQPGTPDETFVDVDIDLAGLS